jgi:trans-aconitate methyltransferase
VAITESVALQSRRQSRLKSVFSVADLRSFKPGDRFDVIVFNEVLYYLSLERMEAEIQRYCQFLGPSGGLIVSLKNDDLSLIIHKLLCKRLERVFGAVFQPQPAVSSWKVTHTRENPPILLTVFRPKKGAGMV